MIQDTPWAPPFVSTTSATAASNAETIAGTSTTKFVTPAALAGSVPTLAASVRNALAPAQALSFNGTAGSTLTLASVPSGDQTIPLDFDVPSSNPSRAMGILALGGAYTTANSQVIYITVAGALEVEAYGATSGDVRYSYFAGFVAAYAGTRVRCIVTISSGVLAINVNGTALTLTNGTVGSAPAWGATLASGLVYVGKMVASDYYFSGTLRLIGIENRALSAAEELSTYRQNAVPSSHFGASGAPAATTVNAGAFVAGKIYRILTVGTTSFTGIGASANTVGVEFVATGVGSGTGTALAIGLIVCPDWAGYTGGPQVLDVSGNGADINLPGDGVTGGVVPALPGATPSPFRSTRTSSGYLIGDQVVIPPGCSVEIWAKGNGTFSLGDSSGTPASIVSAQTAPTALSRITQAGYVTATRKLYLTLGTATSVTVRVVFHAV